MKDEIKIIIFTDRREIFAEIDDKTTYQSSSVTRIEITPFKNNKRTLTFINSGESFTVENDINEKLIILRMDKWYDETPVEIDDSRMTIVHV